jgi:hypothetical protein
MHFQEPQYSVEDLQLEALSELLFIDPALHQNIIQAVHLRMEQYDIEVTEVFEYLESLKGDYSLQMISDSADPDSFPVLSRKIHQLDNFLEFLRNHES